MKKVLTSILLAVSLSAGATCSILYAPSSETVVKPAGTELCNRFYVSVYNENLNAVRYVSERLEGTAVGSASRVNAFKSDARLKNPVKPSEYVNSGFDKGHMAPADDASDADEMKETFFMSNMTPQQPTLNEQSWKQLETKVRGIHLNSPSTPTFIETIPTYVTATRLGRIPVPDGYWKIVTKDSKKIAFYADNKPHAQVQNVSVVDVKKLLEAQKF